MNIQLPSSWSERSRPDSLPSATLGARDADRRLSTGLARGALHEIYANEDDASCGIGFALLLALRIGTTKPIVVIRDDRAVRCAGRLNGEGISALGGNPAEVILVHTTDALATSRAAADAVHCAAVGSVILEFWRAAAAIDLTTSRRLALRAERSGVFAVSVRIGMPPIPSAATTRWQVRAARSSPLAANAPGSAAFDISLMRHRGGIDGFETRVEWDREQRSFRDAPLSRAVPAVARGGARDAPERRAA